MKTLIAIAMLSLLSGCYADSVMLQGPNCEIVRCDPAAAMSGGYIGTRIAVDQCVEQYERMGYVDTKKALAPCSRR